MVSSFLSAPLDHPRAPAATYSRVDLVFYGVDHSGPSFEARVFLNNSQATVRDDRDPAAGYAGSFTVFGHAGCAGDIGHCDVPSGPPDAFDRRPPHALTPQTKTVIVTEAVSRITTEQLTV